MKKNVLLIVLILSLAIMAGCSKSEENWIQEIKDLKTTDITKAYERAELFVEKFPASIEGWKVYASIAKENNQTSEALKAATKWNELDPQNIESARFLAEIAVAEKKGDLVITAFLPFNQDQELTLDDMLLFLQGTYFTRDFEKVHVQVETLLAQNLSDEQRNLAYETNFNAYFLDNDIENCRITAKAAVENLKLNYTSPLFRMNLHLAVDPDINETVTIYQDLIKSLTPEEKTEFQRYCITDFNVLDQKVYGKEELLRVKEIISEHYDLIGGNPSPEYKSIGNDLHSLKNAQMGEQIFVTDPKTERISLFDPEYFSVIPMSDAFHNLGMPNLLINGWQFITNAEGSINIAGFTRLGNIITQPIANASARSYYLDGNVVVLINQDKILETLDISSKELKSLSVRMDNSNVLGIIDHSLLTFSYDTNAINAIDLISGDITPITADPALAKSDIMDFNGTSIYCINAWPENPNKTESGIMKSAADLYRIDPLSGEAEKITQILTPSKVAGSPSSTLDRIKSLGLEDNTLYFSTDEGQAFRMNTDGTGLESIGQGLTLYGIAKSGVFFINTTEQNLYFLGHNAPIDTLTVVKFKEL